MDAVVQVMGVTSTPTQNGGTRFDINVQGDLNGTGMPVGDKLVTFKTDIAQKAHALAGQQASARYEIKQRPKNDGSGFWTNYNLSDIAPVGQLPPLAMPMAGGTALPFPAQDSSQIPSTGGGVTPIPQGSFVDPVEKDKRITRGNAANALGALWAGQNVSLDEFIEAVETLARHIYLGAPKGEENNTPATAEEVAQAVPGVQVGTAGLEQPPAEAPSVQW